MSDDDGRSGRYESWDGPNRQPDTAREWLRWARTTRAAPVALVREFVSTVAFVAAVGLLLFAVSGVWPPMVAVSSGSMEPHMHRGDLVFVVEDGRFAGDAAVAGTGVVTHRSGAGTPNTKFGDHGDVVVYRLDGRQDGQRIIHRARFYVQEGENWYPKADPNHVRADSCRELTNCPAPHAGFVTKGDANARYDQAMGLTAPVKPSWIEGKAMVRVPWLGHLRLILTDAEAASGAGTANERGAISSASDATTSGPGTASGAPQPDPGRPSGIERGLAGAAGAALVGRRLAGS
jgi:signal peptidase